MRTGRSWLHAVAVAWAMIPGCSHGSGEPAVAPAASTSSSLVSSAPSIPAPEASSAFVVPPRPATSVHLATVAAPPPPLPSGIQPGEEVEVRVPGDRKAIVVHARAGNRNAIVYLHGVCGDVYAIRSWARAASEHGTLVAMLGDDACKARKGRFRWFRNVRRLDGRIRRTLEAVKEARGGQLDLDRVTLIGYSQGADRAERVAGRFPERYPRVLLGSPSDAPDPASFSLGQAVAVVAGARENNDKRQEGVKALVEAGYPSVFLALPDAYHGQFGPEGDRVMDEALDWLFDHTQESEDAAASHTAFAAPSP